MKVEEQLKWKNEQSKHLEEAPKKLIDQFELRKKEWELEKTKLLDEIASLHSKHKEMLEESTKFQLLLKEKGQTVTGSWRGRIGFMQLAKVGLQNGDMVHGDSNPLLGDGYSVLTIRPTLLLSANATRCNVKVLFFMVRITMLECFDLGSTSINIKPFWTYVPFLHAWLPGVPFSTSDSLPYCLEQDQYAANHSRFHHMTQALVSAAGSLSFGNEWCSMLGHTSQFECEDPECFIGPVYARETRASASDLGKHFSPIVCLCSLILWATTFTFCAFGLLKIEDGLVDDESLSPLPYVMLLVTELHSCIMDEARRSSKLRHHPKWIVACTLRPG
ncbi:hypothetical protein VNO77_19393 [Canavalia gladiata]|uniref:Uncharacterized protein n=1 Tax=Canavalia gladiata TaxID=3824 RepID=A0AAN9QKG0_CANGL